MDKNNSEVRKLVEALDFSEQDLRGAIYLQPKLFLQASSYRVKKMRSYIEAKALLRSAEARSALFFREKFADEKITESKVKDLTVVAKIVQAAQAKVDEARVSDKWAELLLDAFSARGHACRELVEIMGMESALAVREEREKREHLGMKKLAKDVETKYRGS